MRYARYIKFVMSSKDSFTVTREQAEKIINGTAQFYPITNAAGEWTGETINKSHIIDTKPDWGPQDDEIETRKRTLEARKEALNPRTEKTEIAALDEQIRLLFEGRYENIKQLNQ